MLDPEMRASGASEPRERRAPMKRRARERAGESEGRSPLGKVDPPRGSTGGGTMRIGKLCGGIVFALALAACGGDSATDATPIDPLSKATLVVDGQAFQPSPKGMSALDRGFNTIDILVKDCTAGPYINLSLRSPLTVGTVTAANINQAAFFGESGGQ